MHTCVHASVEHAYIFIFCFVLFIIQKKALYGGFDSTSFFFVFETLDLLLDLHLSLSKLNFSSRDLEKLSLILVKMEVV